MKYKRTVIDFLARIMAKGKEKKFMTLLIAMLLFAVATLISRYSVSKYLWFGMFLPIILFLLFMTFILLIAYLSYSENLLQKKISFRCGKISVVIFLGIMLAMYLLKSYSFNKGLSDYIISGALDTTSFFTQAKIFAEGHINVPSHPLKEFFHTGYCVNDGRFFSKYPPGWPLVLSLGIVLKLPWIMNPIVTCLSLYVIFLLGVKLYDRETACIAIIFTAVSPLILWGSSSYFSEPMSLLFSTLFFYAAVCSLESSSLLFPGLAGLCLGVVFSVRPYSAVAIALPLSVYWLVCLAKHPKLIKRGSLIILAFLPLLLANLAYNYYQTGSPWLLPVSYYNPLDKPGFGLRTGDTFLTPFYYGPLSALRNLGIELINLNWKGLPLLFLFIGAALGGCRKKWDLLLCFTSVSIITFHCFYFAISYNRYYYPILFAIFLISARGAMEFEQFLKKHLRISLFGNLKTLSVVFTILCSLILINIPGWIIGVRNQAKLLDPFLQVHEQGITDSIIFLKTVPEIWNNLGYYIQNSPNFDDSVLFVKDLGIKNSQLMEHYPNRTYYYYEFDRANEKGKLSLISTIFH